MPEDDAVIEAMARSIDPDVWRDDLPIPTRDGVASFHAKRQLSCVAARRALAAYRAEQVAL